MAEIELPIGTVKSVTLGNWREWSDAPVAPAPTHIHGELTFQLTDRDVVAFARAWGLPFVRRLPATNNYWQRLYSEAR